MIPGSDKGNEGIFVHIYMCVCVCELQLFKISTIKLTGKESE